MIVHNYGFTSKVLTDTAERNRIRRKSVTLFSARILQIMRSGQGERGLLFILSMVYTSKVDDNTEERFRRKTF